MRKFVAGFLSALTLLFLILGSYTSANAAEGSDEYRILFISSYSYAWDTVQIQIEGIKKGITSDVVLDYEFMDTKRFPDDESIELFYEGLAYRLERLEPYDAIIVGDDAALRFAVAHQEDIFKDIPIVFEGVNDLEYAAKVSESPLITGVVEALSVQKNIDFALTLYPKAKRVIAILDDSVTGQAERRSFYNNASLYPQLAFTEINCSALTTDELINAIKSIPEDSILIYIVMTEDASGKNYNSHQSVQLVSEYAPVPALRMVSGGIGEGLLGGNIVSMELSGKLAAEMANAIAHGKDCSEYDVIVDSPNIYYIDEAVMRKFNLNLNLIPKDAEVINHLPSFWAEHYTIIIPATIIVILLLIVIALLFKKNIKQNLITNQLNDEKKNLTKSSNYDFLTGLANRSKLYSDLEDLNTSHASCALFIFDIDGFKQINDTYGHTEGDHVLAELGKRISSIKDPAFTPYRLAGDEFICIYKTRNYDNIDECARRCLSLFQTDFVFDNLTIPVRISLGIAVSPDDCNDMKKLIECADEAMYSVKKNGKNSYAWYKDIK
ncbi:MAG: ABC transporter substrate binding protein [Lachnospiraceae bacterium]